MMMLMILSIMTTIVWINMSSNNPMNLSLSILLMAMLLSIMYSLTVSSWFSLILFLIYIGGMMVMFSYFIGLSSNDTMVLKYNLPPMFLMPLILLKSMNFNYHPPMFLASQFTTFYSMTNMIMLFLLTMFLLMMMVIVVKMVKMKNGPLRGFDTA